MLPRGDRFLREAAQTQETDVVPGLAVLREVGQDLADYRGELEAVPRTRRGDHDLGKFWQHVDDEMLVRGIREHAGAQGHNRAVRRRKVARGRLAQRSLVVEVRLPLKIVRIDPLLKMMVKTDLESRHVVPWETVISPFWNHEVEHREALWNEERRLQRREPTQNLTLRLGEIGEPWNQRGHPGAGREHETPRLVGAAIGCDAYTIAERFPGDDPLPSPDVRTGGQGALDVSTDAALRKEKAAVGLEERQVAGRQFVAGIARRQFGGREYLVLEPKL